MIEDLKRDSARFRQDQDRRSRQGRSTGTPLMNDIPRSSPDILVESYASYARQQVTDFTDVMDMDDDFPPTSRHRDIDPRDPRGDSRTGAGRHAVPPVSSAGYGSDPYPAYSIGSNQAGNYGPESMPRYGGGNTTPPTVRTTQAYSQAGYGARTSAATAPPMQAYRDPRTGQVVQGYDPAYESGRRHGR